MGTKRITINIFATYAQTAVSLMVGLFASRWSFNALGAENYGLFAVVGSIITFVAFLNDTLIGASGRFFAFALGQQKKADGDSEILCKWFNTALSVQMIIPFVLIIIGAPIGVYAILNWMNIPDGLRMSCIYIFGISLFTMFHTMLFSPIVALYYAKQFHFVRNLFAILNTFIAAAGGWWLLHYDGNRLLSWAVFCAAVPFVNNIAYAVIAYWQFPEARIRLQYWFDKKRLREMFSYSAFTIIANLGALFNNSGVAIILNKFHGPTANAAMGIGTQVNQKIDLLSQAFNSSIQPEIITRMGAGDLLGAKRLANRVCVYSSALALLVSAPIVVYAQEVLVLWLKNPAENAAGISILMIARIMGYRMVAGYFMLIHASGRIKTCMTFVGLIDCCRLFIVLLLFLGDVPLIPALWLGLFLPVVFLQQSFVLFARHIFGKEISIRHYVAKVLTPIGLMITFSFAFSFGFKAWFGDSIQTILLCFIGNASIVAVLFWLVIGSDERKVVLAKIMSAHARIFKARRSAAN